MKALITSSLFVLSILFFSCAPNKQEIISDITELENSFNASASTNLDLKVANSLLEAYDEFIINFQTDSLSDLYLYRASKLAVSIKKTSMAEEYLKLYLANYPNGTYEDEILFGLANIYENQMQEIELAEKYYHMVIDKFPDSKFAFLAKQSIQTLGKTPDEIVEMLLKKQQDSDSATVDSVMVMQ